MNQPGKGASQPAHWLSRLSARMTRRAAASKTGTLLTAPALPWREAFSRALKAWKPLSAALILVLCCLLAIWALGFGSATAPMDVSLWYWHSPFRLSREEARELHLLGMRRLFVRAGTLSASGDGVKFVLPQIWRPSPGAPPLDLVFVLDPGVIQHFDYLCNPNIAHCLVASFVQQKRTAEQAGLSVHGMQLDFDCATRLLPKYTDLLQRVRRELPARANLSITSLPTWFTSSDLRALIQQVDFYCPQFYETQIAGTLSEALPVSDLRALRNGLASARKLGKPFYAGIPVYGHAFMFDDHQHLLGSYRGMSATEAMRHPSFRLARSWPADASAKPAVAPRQWIGEEFADFVAVHPGVEGKGLGYHLLYSLPTAKMLSVNLDVVRKHRPRNCLGVILFRSPAPEEIMVLPLPALSAVLQGYESHPAIHVKVKTSRAPWGMIEGNAEDASLAVTVSLTNTGDASSSLSADAVTLTLAFDAPGVRAALGDFDNIAAFSSSYLRASPARASLLVCTCSHLGVGETITVGPIQVIGKARAVRGEWRVKEPGGFASLTGTISPRQLQQQEGTP